MVCIDAVWWGAGVAPTNVERRVDPVVCFESVIVSRVAQVVGCGEEACIRPPCHVPEGSHVALCMAATQLRRSCRSLTEPRWISAEAAACGNGSRITSASISVIRTSAPQVSAW